MLAAAQQQQQPTETPDTQNTNNADGPTASSSLNMSVSLDKSTMGAVRDKTHTEENKENVRESEVSCRASLEFLHDVATCRKVCDFFYLMF